MPAQRFFSRSLPFLGASVLFLGACEVALRLAGFAYPSAGQRTIVWSAERDAELRSGRGVHALDAHQLWKPRPGACIPWTKDEHVNAAGFRGPLVPLARTPGVLRIALLGDDVTFGTGLPWDETYAALLARGFAEIGIATEIVDAGVEGTTIVQGIERYRADVRPYQPDVVVCAYAGAYEHTAAPGSCEDAERLSGACGAPIESVLRSSFPRDDVRVLQVAAWLRDMYFGSGWAEIDFRMQERRLAKSVGKFDGAGVRRVRYEALRDLIVEFANEIRADGAIPVALVARYADTSSFDTEVMHYYQLAAEKGAEQGSVPLALGRRAFYEGVRLSRIPPGDLFTARGTPSDCGHILLAQELIDTILPRVPDVVRHATETRRDGR